MSKGIKIYNIKQLSEILNCSVSAIHAHLARKNYDAVPPEFRLGRKLAWSAQVVDSWLEDKIKEAEQSR